MVEIERFCEPPRSWLPTARAGGVAPATGTLSKSASAERVPSTLSRVPQAISYRKLLTELEVEPPSDPRPVNLERRTDV